MSKFLNGLGSSAGTVGTFAAVAIVLAVGVWIGNKPDAINVTAPAALVQPQADQPQVKKLETDTDTQTTTDAVQGDGDLATDNDTAAENAAQPVAAPAFDEVRREKDGMTVVAGRAAPGATVRLLRDGEVIATTTADGSGKFATLAIIAPDGQGHVLSLSQRVDGADMPSNDEIILAPTQAPAIVVADATPAVPSSDTKPAAPAPLENGAASETSVTEPATPPQGDAVTSAASETPAVAVLKSTAEGVELLNPGAPEVMASVALDTISYSDEGNVQLAGRAQPDTQTVRVYLDNDAVIHLPVDDQGRWRGDVPDVDEGIYTLRVDEVGADGSVTSRVETPFKRESAAALTQAAAAQDGPIKAITVQTGATLWAIARERYGDGQLYVRVFEANAGDIRDPDLIYPGQVFDLPD